ncbi:MAG: hypothetical protein U0640_01800 [Phycisphaerales bacterium]
MNAQTKKIVLVAVAVLALAGAAYFIFFQDSGPKVDPVAQQQQDALTKSYEEAQQQEQAKKPAKSLELEEQPKPATNPGGGMRKAPEPK